MKFFVKYTTCITAVILMSAGSSFAQSKKKAKVTEKKAVTASTEDIDAGRALVQRSDCMTCHKSDVKLVGPAFVEVSKKYPSNEVNVALLAGKIIKGGAGVWGQIPMTAHASVSPIDAKKMVKYILSLK